MDVKIRRLRESDNRDEFQCGDPELNAFFQKYAGQNQFIHHIGVTFVAVHEEEIVGFCTIATGSISCEELPEEEKKGLPEYPLPILRLARLGVDLSVQEKGIGRALLRHVLEQALDLRDSAGCIGVIADAKPEAVDYYSSFGFIPLEEVREGRFREHETPIPMFLSIQEIEHASESS